MLRLWIKSILNEGGLDFDFVVYGFQMLKAVYVGNTEAAYAFWHVGLEELIRSYGFLGCFVRGVYNERVDV